MISIVTSTYKRPQLLKRAIESVLAQTYEDWELIIVNDDPDYETKGVIESFNDKRICYIAMSGHFGCDTRPKNRGIQASSGKYIAFLDDDSVFRPDHLQALLKALEANPSVAGVYGDRWIYEAEKSISIGIYHEFDPYLMMRRNYIDTSDVLIRKEAIVAVGGFDERYKKYVDWNLWVRMMKAGYRFKRVPLVLTDYHVYPHSKSNRKEDERGFSVPAWEPVDIDIHVPYLSPEKEPRVGIFTITYDRLEYTKKSFGSLWDTAEHPFTHLVVDNGSSDNTPAWLDNYILEHKGNVITKKYKKNMGISVASNYAIKELKDYDIIVKVDNDAIFLTKGWLKRMVELWKSNRMLVMSPYVQGLKDNPGGAPRGDYGMIKGEYLGLTRHIGGMVHFADSRAYDGFMWDEKSPKHGMQDLEISQYLVKRGYQHAYLENYYVSHGPSGTEAQQKEYPEYFERRKEEKVVKDINTVEHWDEVYAQEGEDDPNFRDDLVSWKVIERLTPDEGTLLDMGCGSGYLLSYLEKSKPNLNLIGIDLSPEGIKTASKRTKAELKVGNILSIPLDDETVDCLVSTEVMEHIVEVERAVKDCARVIKSGGRIVNIFPYKDYVPNAEHVREYDESVVELYNPYFNNVKVEVITHPIFIKYNPDGSKEQCKLLVVSGDKK